MEQLLLVGPGANLRSVASVAGTIRRRRSWRPRPGEVEKSEAAGQLWCSTGVSFQQDGARWADQMDDDQPLAFLSWTGEKEDHASEHSGDERDKASRGDAAFPASLVRRTTFFDDSDGESEMQDEALGGEVNLQHGIDTSLMKRGAKEYVGQLPGSAEERVEQNE